MKNENITPIIDQTPTNELSGGEKPKNSRIKIIATAVLVLILLSGALVAAYFFINPKIGSVTETQSSSQQEVSETTTLEPSITSVFSQATPTVDLAAEPPEIPTDWNTHSTDAYSFRYPLTAKVSTEGLGSNSLRITFMGQKQIDSGRTQTELWDGYAVTITKRRDLGEKGLEQVVSEDIESSKQSCPTTSIISEPLQTTVDGKVSVEYTDTCMGEAVLNYVSNSNVLYVITRFNVGDEIDLPGYKETTSQIVKSLRFQ